MPRYLVQASYTSAAAAAFISNPQDRVAGLEAVVNKLEGRLESFDFSLGDHDVVAIFSAADDATAAALGLAVNAAGHLKAYKTTRLLSPQEFMTAQKRARGLNYQPPSRE
jgi:uncharacterized protein with GYD domain